MQTFLAQEAELPSNAIVFIGSSSIVRWTTLADDMAPLTTINRGFGGSTLQDAIYWLDTLIPQAKPRAFVLYEGDNDIGAEQATAEQVAAGFKTLVARIQHRFPAARIYVLAIKPSVLRRNLWPEMERANQLLSSLCEQKPQLHFIDVASPMLAQNGQLKPGLFVADGVHMSAAGYAIWTAALKPILLASEQQHEYALGAQRDHPAAQR